MNKTTDELMNLLMSKEDLPQYIEENSNEFLQSSLCQYLNQLQTEHGLKKGDIIADALVERSYGYQIFSGRKEMPSRDVLISFALAMELSLDETDDLLERAGYALSHASKFDVIVEYFIVSGKYNIFDINEVLFKYDQPLLGG